MIPKKRLISGIIVAKQTLGNYFKISFFTQMNTFILGQFVKQVEGNGALIAQNIEIELDVNIQREFGDYPDNLFRFDTEFDESLQG